MAKNKNDNKTRYFDIILVLILLLVLSTFLDLNITLEQIIAILTG